MFKKIFVTTLVVAVSSVCLAAAPNNQKAINDTTVAVVKSEINRYKNLSKLQKAQMLVSHKSVEDETKIRRAAYFNGKPKETVRVDSKTQSIKSMPTKNKSVSLQKSDSSSKKIVKPDIRENTTSELSFRERLKTKFGIDLGKPRTNQYIKEETKKSPLKATDNSKVKALQKKLQEARAYEAQLQKENNAMKTELKKSISVMQKLKQEKK